jgi:hypothetical protein
MKSLVHSERPEGFQSHQRYSSIRLLSNICFDSRAVQRCPPLIGPIPVSRFRVRRYLYTGLPTVHACAALLPCARLGDIARRLRSADSSPFCTCCRVPDTAVHVVPTGPSMTAIFDHGAPSRRRPPCVAVSPECGVRY